MSRDISLMPLPELRGKGFEILVRELGPANALRFLGLYQAGSGDYTEERDQWLGGLSLEEIETEIKRRRQKEEI
jgi:hypothetical protein